MPGLGLSLRLGRNRLAGLPAFVRAFIKRVTDDGGTVESPSCIEIPSGITPTILLPPSGYKAGTLYAPLPSDGSGDFSVTRATTATRINEDGLIESVAANVPRIDYTGGGCPSLLLEPQRTNVVTNSELLDTYFTSKANATITDTYGVSPRGDTTSSRIQFAGTAYALVTVTATVERTASVYVKGTAGETIRFGLGANVAQGQLFTFNGDWQRIDDIGTTETNLFFSNLTGVTATDFEAWGLQLEEGAYPTSYIPTAGTTITRNADVINLTGAAALLEDSEGTFFVEAQWFDASPSSFFSLSDGSSANRVYFFNNAGAISFVTRVANANQCQISGGTATDITFIKLAGAYKEDDFGFYQDGTQIGLDNVGSTYSAGTLTRVGFDASSNGSVPFYGRIRQLAVFPTRLTNAELQTLTQ